MELTREELLHLAKLSRIGIDEAEFETFQPQLANILDYVGRLQAIELSGASADDDRRTAIVRQDVPEPSSPELLNDLQAAFPDRADHLLRVPGVFEKPKD